MDASAHPFGYRRSGPRPSIVRLVEAIGRRRSAATRSQLFAKSFWTGLELILRPILLVWAIWRFDAFVLMFGTSFVGGREFWLLRRLGKRLIFVFFGSDARPPYLDGADHQFLDVGSNSQACVRRTRVKKDLVRRAERHATALICHPPAAQLLERPFVNFLDVGIPLPLPAAPPSSPADPAGIPTPPKPIRILHAPSNPSLKGTPRIRAAVADLQRAGHAIELVEVVGQPNDVVLRELAACDLVVDQLYSDSPMAGFAAEAAQVAKPAIVGSFDWPEIEREVGAEALPPSRRCHPDDLAEAILGLAQDRDARVALGIAAQRFVEDRWSPEAVARRYLRIAAADVPAAWIRDPGAIEYVFGWGLDASRVAATVRLVIDDVGVAGLAVDDKPALERRLVELARQ